jgi:hypothetical protein
MSESERPSSSKRPKLDADATDEATGMDADATDQTKGMDEVIDAPPKNQDAKELLLGAPSDLRTLRSVLCRLTFTYLLELTDDLEFLKTQRVRRPSHRHTNETMCGMKLYSMDQNRERTGISFLDFTMRKSNLFYEREHYEPLYQQIMKICEEDAYAQIVITGSSGIGKTFFQIHILRCLLEDKGKKYRFLVHQFVSSFYLYDFVTCQVWKLRGDEADIARFLESLDYSLYLFEPGFDATNRSPLDTKSRAISTLSPGRFDDYRKEKSPRILYMPVWTFRELSFVTVEENTDADINVKEQYFKFGGIIRNLLEPKQQTLVFLESCLINSVKTANIDILRSLATGIADGTDNTTSTDTKKPPKNTGTYNLSELLLCYSNIEESGPSAFQKSSLKMTSEYASRLVSCYMDLESARNGITHLISHLKGGLNVGRGNTDKHGKDLEISAIHFLSLGEGALQWEYKAVGQIYDENSTAMPLH